MWARLDPRRPTSDKILVLSQRRNDAAIPAGHAGSKQNHLRRAQAVKDKQTPLQEALLPTPGHGRHRLQGLGLQRTSRSQGGRQTGSFGVHWPL